VSDIQVRAK